ncbi:MAG TPA: phosphate ABC transporter permease PstA [Thermoanaerobaculia bacterium]|nr:phosphate ABC transporter permease PstA [Thermoanaerobaculia bacterium]
MTALLADAEPQAASDTVTDPRSGGGWRRPTGGASSLIAAGEPMLWLTGGAMLVCLAMIQGLLALVAYQGFSTFWPRPIVRVETLSGGVLVGEVTRHDSYRPGDQAFRDLPPEESARAREAVAQAGGGALRRLVRTGNFDLTGEHFAWVSDFEITAESEPEWALVFERMAWGRFYGEPRRFLVDGEAVAEDSEAAWRRFEEHHGAVRRRFEERRSLETHEVGKVNHSLEAVRLSLRDVELRHGRDSTPYREAEARVALTEAELEAEFAEIRGRIDELNRENARFAIVVETSTGAEHELALAEVVRAYPANRLGPLDKVGIYLARWWEFLAADPREANSEGGVFPAIFGTVVMTLLMSFAVVPFGVLAALYLREYAKAGSLTSAVRIAVNNLAGVPSIVFGVFGLGFFCYIVGGQIDQLFYSAKLPSPTFGTGGVMWASLTLALLTLPVVIVATEEALAAVPGSMREGSYACGASKWQTIRRIVLPRATPGIMTGMILAMARGAGEVAPLMLVGAVKLAPELPVDGVFPFLHLERSFMHLGFHIFDLGFQSQNSEAAKPMVYTTTLLLIAIIALLNLTAIALRSRLRRRFVAGQF